MPPPPPEQLYHYRALVQYVYDGDTIRADIDLGFNTWIRNKSIRLARINAPEIRGEERPQGLITRDYLRDLLSGKDVLLRTYKDTTGKYGRYIGEIFLEELHVNDHLVEEGLAEYADYT